MWVYGTTNCLRKFYGLRTETTHSPTPLESSR
ncbi:hypothetical protein HID58_080395 [Brassica napus]|uniref:Uncharacterized protein n=1 Tax=Brassica napus TaxID=3708 RepID=A0ABQ7Y4S3_BRANA|nr:hypothetical protein HID58_080395 [Brassica napus]